MVEGTSFGTNNHCFTEYSGPEQVPDYECVEGCPVAELDRQSDGVSRFFYVAKPSKRERNAGLEGLPAKDKSVYSGGITSADHPETATGGGNRPAANHHPTVKPLQLMRYLVRLVTPPGGVVLDPFAGSGTTLMAAVLEGFDAIGCELTEDYLPIIEGRVAWAKKEAAKPKQQELFAA